MQVCVLWSMPVNMATMYTRLPYLDPSNLDSLLHKVYKSMTLFMLIFSSTSYIYLPPLAVLQSFLLFLIARSGSASFRHLLATPSVKISLLISLLEFHLSNNQNDLFIVAPSKPCAFCPGTGVYPCSSHHQQPAHHLHCNLF